MQMVTYGLVFMLGTVCGIAAYSIFIGGKYEDWSDRNG
jgi:hypothetical protein